jgi:hypothetical protein
LKYGKGENVIPETPFEKGVMDDSRLFQEYGMPFDPRKLPAPEYQAHLAIVEGMQRERAKENKKAKQEAEQARNQ